MGLLDAADGTVEIKAEVSTAIERVGRRIGIGARGIARGNAGQCCQSQLVGGEKQITVAALKADLGFEPDARADKAPPRPRRHRPFEPVGKSGRMRAAAHRFAVGVEHQSGDIAQTIGGHGLGQPPLQSLDGKGCGDLTDETPGVGKPGLHRNPPAPPGIGTIVFLSQHRIEKAAAMFQCALGLEQRRDIDLVGNAEQLGEIQRGEHDRWLFAFGYQHADRGIGIDVVEYLRHDQELAQRGAVLDGQRRHVRAQRMHFCQQLAQPHQRGLTAQIKLAIRIDAAADGVLQLRIVHPEVDPAHAKPIGLHCGDGDEDLAGDFILGTKGCLFQLADNPGKAGELVRVGSGELVRNCGESCRIGQVRREQRAHCRCIVTRAGQPGGDIGCGCGQIGGVSCQPHGLFGEAKAQAGGPGNVSAPVHVIADPGGKAEWHRGQFAPAFRPLGAGHIECLANHARARGLRPANRRHRFFVLVIQRDRIAVMRGNAGRALANLA